MARPAGSTAKEHKVRRDYRFTAKTMHAIDIGIGLMQGARETTFVEQAIAHYAQFLAGDMNSVASSTSGREETEQLRAQMHILEDENTQAKERLRQAKERLRIAEDQLHQSQLRVAALERQARQGRSASRTPKPAPEEKQPERLDLSKAYQIKIRHEAGQACPELPSGFAYDESEITESIRRQNWAGHDHPVHTVLTKRWAIAAVRREVERLKDVSGLSHIWIARNGEPISRAGGYTTDFWVRKSGKWVKD
jgi:hypothetical protein